LGGAVRTVARMVFVVERYLPGLDCDALLRSLERLHEVAAQLRCQFEAASSDVAVLANERAALSHRRIVVALTNPSPAEEVS
jgi:hypothetical protein